MSTLDRYELGRAQQLKSDFPAETVGMSVREVFEAWSEESDNISAGCLIVDPNGYEDCYHVRCVMESFKQKHAAEMIR